MVPIPSVMMALNFANLEGVSLATQNEALMKEVARLAEENAALSAQRANASLAREYEALTRENARLKLSAQMVSGAPPGFHRSETNDTTPGFSAPPGLAAPPGLEAPQMWRPTPNWGCNDPSMFAFSKDASASLRTSFASTGAGSSVTASLVSDDEIDLTDSGEERTTVMVRNLPNNYSRKMLLELMDMQGFVGQYNMVYLPIDFNTNAGFGYAFVNFTETEHAECFMSKLQGFRKWVMPSEKVCDVMWSQSHQGLHAHIERYRNSPVMRDEMPDEFKPVIFVNGARVQFPAPTKKLRGGPRTKRQ